MAEEHYLALARWRAELKRARKFRRRLRIRFGVGVLGVAVLGVTILVPPGPRLVWNASASAPIGLYGIAGGRFDPGDLALAQVPARWRKLASDRRYLPTNVPIVKRVAASSGDEVCAVDERIFINGRTAAVRRAHDGRGRPMPRWNGCVLLQNGALFLLMADSPHSFDGRYFGPTAAHDIIGKARPLWIR